MSERYFSSVEQDINVISKFHEIYRDEETYRLARYFVPLIRAKDTRFALSEYVLWDLLERNVHGEEEFSFDENHGDWHMFGELFKSLCSDAIHPAKYESTFGYWQDLKRYTLEVRWPMHAVELDKLYAWTDRGYLVEAGECGLRLADVRGP